ncbi:MAG: protein kinase [Haloarculaceae archaeon]
MSPPEDDELDEPRSTLVAVVGDSDGGRERLPYLVGLLDHDERPVRIGAAWTLCLVAERFPDMVPYLVRRLVDRLDDPDCPLEVAYAFEYVADRHSGAVDEELAAIRADADDSDPLTVDLSGPTRSYHDTGLGSRPVGRTRIAAGRAADDPRRVYTDDDTAAESDGPVGGEPATGDESGDGEATDGEVGSDEPADSDLADATGEDTEGDTGSDDQPPLEAGRLAIERLPAVGSQHRFDELNALATSRRGRYGDVYRSIGRIGNEQLGVGVTLFHHPGNEQERSFVEQLDRRLADWQSVHGHENVVTVYDWSMQPRPWAAVEYTDETLADAERFSADEARWQARRLADAVRHLHESGVVHAGIDPQNVAYYGNVLDEDERQPPLLTNVGLMHVFRFHFDPDTCLDPRFAAPEYFDRRFGRIDHASDIYQLGAVCYRLFTGRAPFTGSFDTVRERVLDADPPVPSDVVDGIPSAVDEIVTKAMARSKLNRYESVTHMRRELAALDGGDHGG